MFSIKDSISEEIYILNTNLPILITNIDIKDIYSDDKFIDILSSLKIDDKLLIEKFPLLQLINNNHLKKYNLSNILNITDLTLEDLNCKDNLEFLNKQAKVMRYFFNNFNIEGSNRLIIFLTLLDFCLKTIKINNVKLNITIKDKIKTEKEKLLKIINNDLYDKIYDIFENHSK